MRHCTSVVPGVLKGRLGRAENHYYPFGMNMEGPWSNNVATRDSKYMYNGKELEDDFGLNMYAYGFRYLDPAINRFISVDPLAMDFPELTTFQYASNRPVDGIDLDGLEYVDAQGRQLGPINPQEYANKTGIIVMEAKGFEGVNKEIDMYYPEITVTADKQAYLTHGMISPIENPVIRSEKLPKRVNPVDGVVRAHNGIDIVPLEMKKVVPVLAPTDGRIESVKTKDDGDPAGNRVHMKDKDGQKHSFFHLRDGMKVKAGESVKKGDTIGIMGNTGRSKGAHLRYEMRDPQGNRLDPRYANPSLRNAPKVRKAPKA